MEHSFDLRDLIRDDKLARDTQALYAFFTESEVSGTHFTRAKIREYFPRSPSSISKYVRNYWSWFLRKESQKQGRADAFSCHGLQEYPAFHFVLAHQRNQGKYFRHFSEALLKGRERDQETLRAKLQETPLAPSDVYPNVPDQQEPEEIHIEEFPLDEETDEDELEQPQDLGEVTQQEDNDETLSGPGSTRKERTNFMSIFTLDKQLNRLRDEIMQELGNMRSSIVDQVRAELASSTQALGRTLTGEIQGLPVPLGEPTFTRVIQILEQSLAAKQDQTGSELPRIAEKLEQLQRQVQEILPSISGQFPPLLMQTSEIAAKLSPLSPLPESVEQLQSKGNELSSQISQLLTATAAFQQQVDELSKSSSQPSPVQAKIDGLLSQFDQESPLLSTLQELREQVGGLVKLSSQSSSVPGTLEQIRTKVGDILVQFGQLSAAWAMNERLGVELLPIPPSGDQRPDDLIKGYIQNTIEAISALEQKLTIWLDQHYLALRQDDQTRDENLMQALKDHMTSQRAQRFYNIQEEPPVSTETLAHGEQNIPLINQPSEPTTDRPNESDTGNDTTWRE